MTSLIKKLENIKTANTNLELYKFVRKNGIQLPSNSCTTEIYQIGKRAYSVGVMEGDDPTVYYNEYATRQLRKAELDKIEADLKASL